MKQKWKRIGSLILSVCMVFTMLPTMAFAETGDVDSGASLGVSGTITAFEKLSAEVAEQTVETGTAEDELNLPDELTVTVTTGSAITATVSGNATATDSEAEEPEKAEPEEVETTVEVSGWTSDPAYDGDTAGVYTFTPSLALPKGLTVAGGVYAPQITITVEEAAAPQARDVLNTVAGTIEIAEQPIASLEADYEWDGSPGTISVKAHATNGADVKYQWVAIFSGGVEGRDTTDNKSSFTIPMFLPEVREYYCELTAEGCTPIESDKTTVTINKATYSGIESDTIYVMANRETIDNAYTLPSLPVSDMSYEVNGSGSSLISGTPIVQTDASTNSDWVLIFNTTSQPANTQEDILLTINGDFIYKDSSFTLTVKTFDKIPVNITGVTGTNDEFSGNPHLGYIGEPDTGEYAGELDYIYKGRDGTDYDSEDAPTNPGDYTATISIPVDEDYEGVLNVDFSIKKKEIKIKTADVFILQGEELLPIDNIPVNYIGFVGKDNANNSISQWAVPKYTVSNSNTPGTSPITFETEAILKADKERNYVLKHEDSLLTIQPAPVLPTYKLTVNNGIGSGEYEGDKTVTITANSASEGKRFKEWNIEPTVEFVDGTTKNSSTVKLKMPNTSVTATATYEAIPGGTVSVNGVSLNKSTLSLYSNTTPDTATLIGTVTPSDATNKAVTWVSGNTAVATVDQSGNVKAVGNGMAVITATTTDGGYTASCTVMVTTYSSGGDGGSSSGGSPTTPITTTPGIKPNQPVTASAPVTATAGAGGSANAAITDKTITDAIAKAQADVKAQGKTANGTFVALNITMPKGATSLTTTLTRSSLNSLISAGVTSLEINGSPVAVTFDLKALQEIQKQSSGTISITIAPNTNLSAAAKAMIGTRPVYDITISYTKDGKNATVTSFGGGVATVSIPYAPAKGETVGALYAVHVDNKGNATRIAGSAYDVNSRSIIFTTTHFSLYGIGYTAPSAKFTDIYSHWGKEAIDYVVGRGLLSGASDTTFAPNNAMTRGMLVTALGSLSGVDTKLYTANSFTDVKADSAFRPYIEWAYSKCVVQGIGNSQFAPDRAITREEIAVIFANYAKATGYKLPVTREATTYGDASSIGSAYKTAVTAMQQAGIMMGGTGNKFNPKCNATRAEVSSMLHRYIKLTIDPDTALGWALNDAGQYLYYKNGKVLSGMQTIGGMKYFFNTDGTLKTGWVKDGDNWRYYSENKAAIGWLDISDKRYYFTKEGLMVSGKWLEIDGKWYYLNADGSLAKDTKIGEYEVDENGVWKTK